MNSLGIDKPPSQTRVVVAMSGGVDSSVCAALLAQQGYEVIGVTLQLYDFGKAVKKTKACCAGQDIYDAKRVASTLNFPHYVLDYESRFHEGVMKDFADSYARGETPIPCIRCNQSVKFTDLLHAARDLDADCLATGHYVQRYTHQDKNPGLYCAIDANKDQSYFLFATTQNQLNFLRFPLGGFEKTKTRALAHELGLRVASKPDSQDICFVPEGKYTDIVERLRPDAALAGEIVDTKGNIRGTHQGIMHYTVGQRRGLGLTHGSGRTPLFVLDVNAKTRQILVGERENLEKSHLYLRELNWLGDDVLGTYDSHLHRQNIWIKIRSTQAPLRAQFTYADNALHLTLTSPLAGVSPGQACVFYQANADNSAHTGRVLGGGFIAHAR